MVIEKTGQEAGSLPADETGTDLDPAQMAAAAAAAKSGQETGTPTGKEEDKGAAAKTDVDEKDFVEKDGVKYYASFDKHPEWRVMKDAETEYNKILGDNGYKNKEELITALKDGQSLTDLIGDQDATALIEAANNWTKAEEYWAEQDAQKSEEGETADQTIARLKTEKAELVTRQKTENERTQEKKESREALHIFDTEVGSAVDEAKLVESEVDLAKLFLGLNNPMDDIDIQDKKAVRVALTENIGKFKTLVKAVKQSAVDDYVAGKKDIIPVGKAEGVEPQIDTGRKFQVKEDETPEEALGRANEVLVDLLNGVGNQ